MDYDSICKKAESHVENLFATANDPSLLYHNLEHTKKVVSYAREISAHYNLIDADMLVICVAAWFHDTGYLFTDAFHHEVKSAELMKEFMMEQTNDEDLVSNIADCIMATKSPIEPKNLLQQILVDADTYNLGTKEFKITNRQVFDEYNLRTSFVGLHDWNLKALKLLEGHQYFTKYCRDLLTEQKKKNMKKLKKKIEKHQNTPSAEESTPAPNQLVLEKANSFTSKGIQTMLRLTSENHMKLSDMADGKANILISVNAIIISVILGVLVRRLQVDTYLTIPTILFLSSSVITIVFAILATRPKLITGNIGGKTGELKNVNLLFFGNFYKTPLEEYEKAMGEIMGDTSRLYRSLIIDFYQLGLVLARKYRLIRIAYNVFMVGIIISVIAFSLAAGLSHKLDAVVTNSQGGPL